MAKPARTARPKKAAEPAPEAEAPAANDPGTFDHDLQFKPYRTEIPLSQLLLSDLNVRQTERDADIAALAEDIHAGGLEQNLIVVPAHFMTSQSTTGWEEKFEVVGGGRRFQALTLLASTDRLDPDWPVPVKVKPRAAGRETSLSENLHKVAMNPADEFVAFQHISQQAERAGDPDPAAYVAKRFGCSRRHVEGRLRLASLHPDILDALRSGDLTVDSAKAYVGTTDHDLQLKVFKAQAKSSWNKHDPRTVREALRGESLSLNDPRVKFVGIDAYRAAGGRTEAEMFMGTDGEERVTDIALIDRLCTEQAEPLLADRAKEDGFASGLFSPTHKSPKAPAGFERLGYEYETPAPEVLAQRIAVYTLDRDGLYLFDVFKPTEEAKPNTASSYKPMTNEERAAKVRAAWIDVWAARIALGSLAGTPLEGRAFWPTSTWPAHLIDWQTDPDAEVSDDEEAPTVAAFVEVKIRVPIDQINAAREAAEAKVTEIEAEQAARDAKLDDDGDDDDSEFDDTDLEGEDA